MIRHQSVRFILLLLVLRSVVCSAEDASPIGTEFFESKIRPTLVKHCYECHSTGRNVTESGLALDTRDALRRGGDRGPAVVVGDPDASLIVQAISHHDVDLAMPPDGDRLSSSAISDIRQWIRMGAPDPRPSGADAVHSLPVSSGRDRHWAYQEIFAGSPPASDTDWPRRAIDDFILANLRSASLGPSPDADPSCLLRRVYFDLIGLPPTPSQRRNFLRVVRSRGMDLALRREVDRLLARPEFGERWGRHWLDVARYAESSGKESNLTFPHAWRYRDYVIDSFNVDKPYDRFLTEQIAGDLLSPDSDNQLAEQMIATGFLAIGPKSLNEMNPAQFKADLVDEQIDTLTRAVLATSLACARCHDHKSDPFSMEDYYSMAGVFYSTETCFGSSIGPESQIESEFIQLPSLPDQSIPNGSFSKREVDRLRGRVSELTWEKRRRFLQALMARWSGGQPEDYFSLRDALRIRWTMGGLQAKLKTVDRHGQALPLAMGVVDALTTRNVPLLRRGELSMPGGIVRRGFPDIFDSSDRHTPPVHQSGRLQLARWITDPANPLTSRVMANRVWQRLFGEGIVRTVDQFGNGGQEPSHPELLDHLAARLMRNGWSIKSLVRGNRFEQDLSAGLSVSGGRFSTRS